MNTTRLVEFGFIPTWLVRKGIRQRLKNKLEIERNRPDEHTRKLVENLINGPLAIATDDANEQHYQVPTYFYQHILGPRMKYSACYWPEGVKTLKEAEIASLRLVAERSEITDGMSILELGCGWGSFSIWAAEKFPNSHILAVSNSFTQTQYIQEKAIERGLINLEVRTENMIHFDPKQQFERIVSIEMFEHMRNYKLLFERISNWLKDNGKCFVHIFSHKEFTYVYDAEDPNDWMSNYFFTGGMMPSHDLFSKFSKHLAIERNWKLNGMHYTHTLEAWLQQLDISIRDILPIFKEHYPDNAKQWIHRWRMFILACSELFAYNNGEEWGISHYLFKKK